jgi:hypothetical protein
MKLIIAGSRTITDRAVLVEALKQSGFRPDEVICGGARGADELGRHWALAHQVPVRLMLANWDLEGKAAGYRRNERMAQVADALLALWDGESRGTMHMINLARARGLRVHIHRI